MQAGFVLEQVAEPRWPGMQIPKDPRELEIALKNVADNVRSR